VLTEDNKRAAYRALQDRILNGEGRASPEQRARAFSNAGLSQPLDGLLGKVATRPTQVTDADFAAAQAAGFSEDELFELVICAVVGQSARRYDAGLAALADAVRTNYNVPVSWAAPFHVLIPRATAMWWLASCTACFIVTGRRAGSGPPSLGRGVRRLAERPG
jgi:hypothetical protein